MARLPITAGSRVIRDPRSGAIRSWFNTAAEAMTKAPFVARDLAHQVLSESAELFAWQADLSDLRDKSTLTSEKAFSVHFTQEFRGIPVDSSEVVVNMFSDGRIYSIYNGYHYDIPKDLDPKEIKVTSEQARLLVERLSQIYQRREISEPKLIVYRYSSVENHPPKAGGPNTIREQFLSAVRSHVAEGEAAGYRPTDGQYFLAWDITLVTAEPNHSWRVLLDAMIERVVKVIDLLQYSTGTAQVFDPNPIVTGGDTTLRHNSPVATINAQRIGPNVERLNPQDANGNLHLDGSFVQMQDFALPNVADPANPAGNFQFSFDDNSFLDAMAYFHLDRFQNYIQTVLGLNNVANFSIPVDPQGTDGQDNSDYSPQNKRIEYGGGIVPVPAYNPVPDAADAMVVLHEYGHAIQDNVNPGFDNPLDGTGEGFGDFLAAVFYDDKHTNPAATRGFMMSWDSEMGTGSWPGRHYDVDWFFDSPQYTGSGDNHIRGQLWCATMFELYRKLGGDSQYATVKLAARDLAIRLHLMANFHVPAQGSTAAEMGQQVEAADTNLGGWRYANGLHEKVIYDTFRRRHLSGFTDLPVDVYINDGRNGGYGSLTGNDSFNEKLWLETYWETQDLWVKVLPYPSDTAQQAGGPGDHVEPPVNSTAYLYVRIKNKGANNSGPVLVKAFHSNPTIGLVWPDDWTPMDTPSINVADVPAGGTYVAGPFPWTPTEVGHECAFAIVECDSDRAVTQNLQATDHVQHSDLVPFDNNIAQRNLAPTAAKGKMVRGFYVSNPYFEPVTVSLHFKSTLPRGWRYSTNIVSPEAIRLAPRQRRWVEVSIDQAQGPEVTNFAVPYNLAITGTIKGAVVGGMTFYLAPSSAFPAAPIPPCPIVCPSDLFCLNIPWAQCEVEGEIEIKLRFRRKC